MAKDLIKTSKWLALILRHEPSKAGITLDNEGWADVQKLVDPTKGDIKLTDMVEIVRTDDKGRYEFNHDKTKIRAVQGHSIKTIEVEMMEMQPPQILFHGTKKQFMSSIQKEGLKPMGRQHVHLSTTNDTADAVAKRRKGDSVILRIDTDKMYDHGIKFWRAKNGVWLTKEVPAKYIEF